MQGRAAAAGKGVPTILGLDRCGLRLVCLTKNFPSASDFSTSARGCPAFSRERKSTSGQRTAIEQLWREFFSNPSQWWDHRADKDHPNYPDFKHKNSGDALWLNGRHNPPWVLAKLDDLDPDALSAGIFSWNSRLSRLVKDGQYKQCLQLFTEIVEQKSESPDRYTFLPALSACASLLALEDGRWIHAEAIKFGWDTEIHVANGLLDVYAKCGSLQDAERLFRKLSTRNVASYDAMLLALLNSKKARAALDLARDMQVEGGKPKRETFVRLLSACGSLPALEEGRDIHAQASELGYDRDLYVGNSLISMYAKCGSLNEQWKVFRALPVRNAVSWTAMISGLVRNGQPREALLLAREMEQEGHPPSRFTFVAMLKACANLGDVDEGRRIHERTIRCGDKLDQFIGNSLVDMYVKCGSVEDARDVFSNMPARDVVAWTAMIQGHAKLGLGLEALQFYREMLAEGIRPDPVTFVALLGACASVGALEEGKRIHEQIKVLRFEGVLCVGNSLVDMYAKCGSLVDARRMFDGMPTRDAITWSTMLGAYAMHGEGLAAIRHFQRMCQEDVVRDSIAYTSLLAACSHAGLVDEGMHHFDTVLSSAFAALPSESVTLTREQFACVVDLLGRAGRLHEADALMKSMPTESGCDALKALLGASNVHGNVAIGECVGERLLDSDPSDAAVYILLSNIYSAASMWEKRAEIKQRRLSKGAHGMPGRTWIEVDGTVHSFTADDREHTQIASVHATLNGLMEKLRESGYVPDTSFALLDGTEEEKVSKLSYHSEKLAIAFGVRHTPPGTEIRIFKNLRTCGDCHTAIQLMSKVLERTIIVRDANRFHYFSANTCSCEGHW